MQPEFLNREIAIIRDAKAVRFILEPKSSRFLEPFINQELCLSEAAKIIGVRPSSMFYRIKQMLELNLLSTTRQKLRRGKSIKYYKSAFYGYFIPFQNTRYQSPEIMTSEFSIEAKRTLDKNLAKAWGKVFSEHYDWGVRLTRSSTGKIDRSIVSEKNIFKTTGFLEFLNKRDIVLWDQFCTLNLSLDEAKKLQTELSMIYEKYSNIQSLNRKPYYVRLALAKLVSE